MSKVLLIINSLLINNQFEIIMVIHWEKINM
jgi:hypothetical protein